MKSAKSTGRNQAKEAISVVCLILNDSGFTTKIKAEHFRQAKFDQTEAVTPMWAFLGELVQLNTELQTSQETVHSDISKDEIKSTMHWYGYDFPELHDNSGELGSREILLAACWLLAKTNVINKRIRQHLKYTSAPFSTSHLHAVPHAPESCNSTDTSRENDFMSHSVNNDGTKDVCALGRAKYLVWMMGRLRLALKSLYWEQQALCHWMHQTHKATHGVKTSHHIAHLTAWETFLLRHPKHMKKYIEQLEKEATVLQACVRWKELEPVFWQWMESVLDAKLSSQSACSDKDPSAVPSPLYSASSNGAIPVMSQLHGLQETLAKHLQEVDADIALRGMQELVTQISRNPDVAKIKREIENSAKSRLHFDYEEHMKAMNRKFPLHTVQFAYKSKQDRPPRRQNERPVEGIVEMNSEILRLAEGVRKLQKELEDLKMKQRERLDAFAECLANVVCIPPMSEKDSTQSVT